MERDKLGEEFRPLKFCCDWAVHADLSWGPAKAFVKEVDDLFARMSEKKERETEDSALAEIVYLARFRSGLQKFLKLHAVPTEVFDDDQKWRQFLRLYSLVIQDCPLTCKGEGRNLDEVVVTKAETVASPDERAFDTKWELRLKGKTVSVFYLASDGKLRTETA